MLQNIREKQNNEIKIGKSKASLICQYSFQIIRIPVRGEFCKHKQCFCLRSFLEMMLVVENRKWVCPICKKVCLQFVIDQAQQWILEKVRQLELKVESIILDNDGSLDKDDILYQIIQEKSIKNYKDLMKCGFTQLKRKNKEIDQDDIFGLEQEYLRKEIKAESIIID